jgi:ACT domain-containing protein
MNAIITVVGTDQVGIIAKVSGALAGYHINIADITQTILSGNFVMMMMADLTNADSSIEEVRKALDALGDELGVSIHIMHEKVFSAMHRI